MAIPSTNISMSAIRTELGSSSGSLKTLSELVGKSAPHGMNEFAGLAGSQSLSYDGQKVYFGKGAKFASGIMISQPTNAYFSHVATWGSNISPTTLSSGNWGQTMTIAVASFMRLTAGTSDAKVIFEATASSQPPNQTWWNTLTVSKSGYTNPYGFPSSFTYNRSSATISWSATDSRLHISFIDYNSNDFYYDLFAQSGVTWTFSV
jgi:hypothetical protein